MRSADPSNQAALAASPAPGRWPSVARRRRVPTATANRRRMWSLRCMRPGCSACCCRARSAARNCRRNSMSRPSRRSPRPMPAPPGVLPKRRSVRPRLRNLHRRRPPKFRRSARGTCLGSARPQQGGRGTRRLSAHRPLAVRERQPSRHLARRALSDDRSLTANHNSIARASRSGRHLMFRVCGADHRCGQVMGLRGTGSDTYEVNDLFVPEEARWRCSVVIVGETRRRTSLSLTVFHLFGASFAAISLGIARATLDAFVALAQSKTPTGGRTCCATAQWCSRRSGWPRRN